MQNIQTLTNAKKLQRKKNELEKRVNKGNNILHIYREEGWKRRSGET